MLTPNLKLKYELHYWDTDVTGSSQSDWESLHLKPIYFPEKMVGKLWGWKYKVAIGGELIVDFGNEDKGIGSGSSATSSSRRPACLWASAAACLIVPNANKNRRGMGQPEIGKFSTARAV